MIDTQCPVPQPVLEGRLASLQDWLVAQGYDALVVFGLGSTLGIAAHSHGNLRYLLDWDADNAPSALVLQPGSAPALVVGNVFAAMRAREQGLIPNIQFGSGPTFATAIVALLPSGATRVGLVGREDIPLSIWDTLASFGADGWIECGQEMAKRRAIKDVVQIAYHREAARVCDAIFDQLGPRLRGGTPVFAIQAELERFARDQGCEFCQTWLTAMPVPDRCRYRRDENQNIPRLGDQVLLGIMLTLHGHWGHAIRTGALGQPSAAARAAFAAVEDMHAIMLEGLRPGRDLRDVGRAGLAQKAEGIFQFRSGHALGLSYEDGIGTAEFPQPYDGSAMPNVPRLVQAGMLFEVHPNLFVAGAGAAAIGDMVIVTEDGPELLTQYPRGLLAF